MPTVTGYAQGAPSWADLATSDEQGALSFYSQLFGWTDEAEEIPDGGGFYHLQKLGDDVVVGISQQQPDEAAQGVPPHWNTYLAVEDVDATAAEVKNAGGAVIAEPMDVMDAGRMAVLQDPTGGMVALWQPGSHFGSTLRGEPGTIGWQELITTDPDRAASFLQTLLGVEIAKEDMGETGSYTLIHAGGDDAGGSTRSRLRWATCRRTGSSTSPSRTPTRRSSRSSRWAASC
jgi:predicted enzyme related to lactoylglutathione lyase